MNSDDEDCIAPEQVQQKARDEEKTQRNIFNILAGGYNVIKKLKKKAICIVGKTKSGKSTSMHWMAGKTLLGKKKEKGDIVIYQVQTEGIPISDKFFSETLVPNALTLKLKDEQISIVDMAGFQDLTNYRGVIGVSYMLQEVLAQIDEVKFILTIDASTLQGLTVDYIFEPFQNFIKMFEYDAICSNFPQLRDKILDSLVLLVSRANPSIDYYGNLGNAINQLKQQKLKKKNKDKVRKILKHIHQNKKMFIFPKAIDGQYPDQCNFLDDAIGNESWKYLNLKDSAIKNCEKFVQLPFAQSFEKMQQIQQNLFMENIKLRIDSWSKLPPIINAFVKKSAANFLNKSGTYASEFQDLIKFNKEEDRYQDVMTEYDMIQQINQDITIRDEDQKYRKPAVYGLQCVKKLIKFLELIQKFDRVDSVTDMKVLHQKLSKALKIGQQIFCQTYKQEQQWIKFSFIILHSFHEFQSLTKINPYRVNATGIFDVVNLFSQISSKDITLIFIRSKQTKQYFEQLFENQEKCNEYISFFYTFLKSINEDNFSDEAQKQSLKQQMQMEIIRLHKQQARFNINRLKLPEALSATINAQKVLNQYSKPYEYDNGDEQDQSESQSQQNFVNPEKDTDELEDKLISKTLTQKDILNNIENNQIEIYELFGQIFLKKNTKESVLIAKNIFEHIIYIDSACKTYEKLFELNTEKSQKYKILLTYANYCKNSYKFNDSKAILLRAVQYSSNSVERKKTRKLISEFLMDKETLEGDQPNKLSSIKRIKNKPELITQIHNFMNNKDNELSYVSIFCLSQNNECQQIDFEIEN